MQIQEIIKDLSDDLIANYHFEKLNEEEKSQALNEVVDDAFIYNRDILKLIHHYNTFDFKASISDCFQEAILELKSQILKNIKNITSN